MAEHYVSALASGGAGTVGDPWDLDTAVTNFNNSTVANGSRINVKADGTYTTAGITLSRSGNGSAPVAWQGYTTTIADGGRSTIQRSGGAAQLVNASTAEYITYRDLIFDGQDSGTITFQSDRWCLFINCDFLSAGSNGVNGEYRVSYVNCYAEGNSGYGFFAGRMINCISENNGGVGMYGGGGGCINCISRNNTGQNYNLSAGDMLVNCISDGGSSDGVGAGGQNVIANMIVTNSPAGKFGIKATSTIIKSGYHTNLDYYTNDDDTNNDTMDENTFSNNPNFTNSATLDYTRADNALDGDGFSDVGNKGFDYTVDIGIGRLVASTAAPTFAGITQLEAIGGRLRASWSAGTGTITGYKIYIRNGSSTDLFTDTYLIATVDDALTSVIMTTEADGATLLQSTSTYYVGIRADNSGAADTNTVSLSASADGDGSTYLNMNDLVVLP